VPKSKKEPLGFMTGNEIAKLSPFPSSHKHSAQKKKPPDFSRGCVSHQEEGSPKVNVNLLSAVWKGKNQGLPASQRHETSKWNEEKAPGIRGLKIFIIGLSNP